MAASGYLRQYRTSSPVPALAVLLAGYAALWTGYAVWVWSTDISYLGGDSAGYLLAAQAYSPWSESSPLLQAYARQIIYPPLFPALLAAAGGGSIPAAHLVVAGCLLLALIPLYGWLRSEGLYSAGAASAALIFAALPGTLLVTLDVWTENLYLLLSLGAVLAGARAHDNKASPAWWFLAAFVALATLTRVAAVPLLAAFWVYALQQRPRRLLLLLSASTLPFVVWILAVRNSQTGISGYTQQLQERYAASLFEVLAKQVSSEASALIESWRFAWLLESASPVLVALVFIFGATCLTGAVWRLWQRRFDGLYGAFYALLLLGWPHPEEALRYSYVLYPLWIGQGMLLVANLPWRRTSAAARGAAPVVLVAAGLALALAPSLAFMAGRFLEPVPPGLETARHTWDWYRLDREQARYRALRHARMLRHLKVVGPGLPADACVFSIKPQIVMLYARRVSVVPPKSEVTGEAFWNAMAQCRYVYAMPFASPSFREPFYPLARLGERARALSAEPMGSGPDSGWAGALVEVLPY